MGLGIPPLNIIFMLESNPLKYGDWAYFPLLSMAPSLFPILSRCLKGFAPLPKVPPTMVKGGNEDSC